MTNRTALNHCNDILHDLQIIPVWSYSGLSVLIPFNAFSHLADAFILMRTYTYTILALINNVQLTFGDELIYAF